MGGSPKRHLREQMQKYRADSVILKSPKMRAVMAAAVQVARTDAIVLIPGESGTGKGVIARAIHAWSSAKVRKRTRR